MAPKALQKLIDRVTSLKAELKEANAELKEELEDTTLYKAILSATLEQSTEHAKVPEKAAAAQALKVTLAVFTANDEENES